MSFYTDIKNMEGKTFFKKYGAQLLYFASMLFLVTDALFRTAMVRLPYFLSEFLKLAGILLIIAKLLILDRKNTVQFLASLILIAIAAIINVQSHIIAPLYITVLAVGAVGISFKDIARCYFYTASVFVGIIFIASLSGLVENLEYSSERGIRYAFGIVHPTDFSAHIFFIMASYVAAFEKKLSYLNCIGGIAVAVFVYVCCKTRVDCGCIILLWLGLAVIRFVQSRKNQPRGKLYRIGKNICRYICIWSMPAAAVIMLLLSKFYDPSNKFMLAIDNITSGRLSLGKRGLDEYSIKLLGQYVPMRGAGGSVTPPEDYFFLDCSYIYMLLIFGLVFTILIIAAYVLIGMRYKHNGVMLWIIALISLDCMIAHHLPDCAYCIFTAALFAKGGEPLFKTGGFGNKDSKKEIIST